jgi:ribonuclease E
VVRAVTPAPPPAASFVRDHDALPGMIANPFRPWRVDRGPRPERALPPAAASAPAPRTVPTSGAPSGFVRNPDGLPGMIDNPFRSWVRATAPLPPAPLPPRPQIAPRVAPLVTAAAVRRNAEALPGMIDNPFRAWSRRPPSPTLPEGVPLPESPAAEVLPAPVPAAPPPAAALAETTATAEELDAELAGEEVDGEAEAEADEGEERDNGRPRRRRRRGGRGRRPAAEGTPPAG